VTHNSLAATQRPNISLIDRRHFDDVALPIWTIACYTKTVNSTPRGSLNP
jgi:hypothetical protein